MNTRLPIDGKATVLMVLLCINWGLQQVAIKGTAEEVSPMLQVCLRSGIAALLVGLFMRIRKESISLRSGNWRPGIFVGVLFSLEFLFVTNGLQWTSASHMVVFLYTAPIFAALGLHWKLPSERLQPVQWLGIVFAFMGIVATFYFRDAQKVSDLSSLLMGDFLGLLAGLSWGATTVVIRTTRLSEASSRETLLYQLLGAFLLLGAGALLTGQTRFEPTQWGWTSLVYQAIIISFVSFLIWFWLLTKYLASRLGVLCFMTPVFGVLFGVVVLNEPLEMSFILGSMLVFCGVLMVTCHDWLSKMLKVSPATESARIYR